MKIAFKIMFCVALLNAHDVFAQGCSDAGFCSIDGIKQAEIAATDSASSDSVMYLNSVKTGVSLGNTRFGVWIVNAFVGYSRQVNRNMTISVKLDGQYRSGELTQVAGFSDVTLSVTYKFLKSFGMIVGGKIPLSDSNKKLDGNVMPMAYQTSLGTYDIIAGTQYVHKNLFVALAWQHPLKQNSNSYLKGNISEEDLGAEYLETNEFRREGDVLMRVSYNHNPRFCKSKFSFTYSLLPIYHLNNDRYVNADKNLVEIADSRGLTFNTNIFANYKISDRTTLGISTGFPVITRKVRPEGLSQFALAMEFIKRF